MAIAAVDADLGSVVGVAEGDRLLDGLVLAGGIGGPGEP
jgi:hypothetical protein